MPASVITMTPRQLREFVQCDPMLIIIFLWLADLWPVAPLVVTSIHRTPGEDAAAGGTSGIHRVGPPYRAIDIRVSNLPGDAQVNADLLGDRINARYVYDPSRPALKVAVTAPHGTGPHVHLQVHTNTALRTGVAA